MATTKGPYEVPFQNQLQFNLQVPLRSANLATRFHHPWPIKIEHVGSHHAIPTTPIPKPKRVNESKISRESSFNYSVISEDRMELVSMLARRDIRNKKLQEERAETEMKNIKPQGIQVKAKNRQTLRGPKKNMPKFKPNLNKKPVSRPSWRSGAVENNLGSRDVSRDSDIQFPIQAMNLDASTAAKDDITKLQLEMEGYLKIIQHIEEKAIQEENTKFLRPSTNNRNKGGYLVLEEDQDRIQARVDEQSTRSTRNLYNLRQKVKQIQRDVAHADLSKPTKKSQIVSQLTATHRAASKAIQTFVNQLPYQDLRAGLPGLYKDLALVLRQLAALSSLVQQGADSQQSNVLIDLLNQVDSLNSKWCTQLAHSKDAATNKTVEKSKKRSAVTKTWVNDTKVENKKLFRFDGLGNKIDKVGTTQNTQNPNTKSKAGAVIKSSKEKDTEPDKKSLLKSSVARLLRSQSMERLDAGDELHKPPLAWDVELNYKGRQSRVQNPEKGYLLPNDLKVKREKAQRAVELSNQRRGFEVPTVSSRLRSSSSEHVRSASSSPKRKEVNFYLNDRVVPPWLPAGSASPKSPRTRLSRSNSPHLRECRQFLVQDLEVPTQLDRDQTKGSQSLRNFQDHKATKIDSHEFGFKSLPNEKTLRRVNTTDSLLDELEEKLLARIKERRREKQGSRRQNGNAYSPGYSDDLTLEDLTLESDVNDRSQVMTSMDESTTNLVEEEACAMRDGPTLENIRLRLEEMQREQVQIRQRWSTLKFYQQPKQKHFTSGAIASHEPREPAAIEVKGSNIMNPSKFSSPMNKSWHEEAVIFTKPVGRDKLLSHIHTIGADYGSGNSRFGHLSAKRHISLKQTTVQQIEDSREKFESYLRKRSHNPMGTFDPWQLVDEIADEILDDCFQDVVSEVEKINEEIANFMYKSEFMVSNNQSATSFLEKDNKNEMTSANQVSLNTSGLNPRGGEGEGIQTRPGDLFGFNLFKSPVEQKEVNEEIAKQTSRETETRLNRESIKSPPVLTRKTRSPLNEIMSNRASPDHYSRASSSPDRNQSALILSQTFSPNQNKFSHKDNKSPSPINNRSPSPGSNKSPSPINRSPSPGSNKSPSPINRSPSSGSNKSPSPINRSPSPGSNKSPSPIDRSPSPMKTRSPSPKSYKSPIRSPEPQSEKSRNESRSMSQDPVPIEPNLENAANFGRSSDDSVSYKDDFEQDSDYNDEDFETSSNTQDV